MIQVHRLNGKDYVVNADKIKFVEATPDTVITLDNGNGAEERMMVKESVQEIVNLVLNFKRRCADVSALTER